MVLALLDVIISPSNVEMKRRRTMVMMVMGLVVNVDTTVIRDRRAWLDMRPGQCLNGVAPKYGGEGGWRAVWGRATK